MFTVAFRCAMSYIFWRIFQLTFKIHYKMRNEMREMRKTNKGYVAGYQLDKTNYCAQHKRIYFPSENVRKKNENNGGKYV